MKNFYSSALIGLLLLFAFQEVRGQTTVTFDEITTASHLSLTGTGTYDNSGVRFSIIPGPNPIPNAYVSAADNGFGNTKALDDTNTEPEGVKGWSIKKVDGSDFQLVSIWLQEGCDCASTTGTIKAYKDGGQVGSTVNLTFDSQTTGDKVFSSNPDFYSVDEIRIEATDVYLFIDNFRYGDAISVGDEDPPVVTGINLVGTPFSTVTSVDFTVSFSKNAKNVSADDFQLTTAGTVGTIASVTGSGSTYTVTVNGIDGEGTIRLDLKAGTNIANEDDFSGTPAYTGGQLHYVGSCYTESFENKTDGATSFSSNGRTFTLGTGLEVENRVGFGAGQSNRYIKNNFTAGTFTMTADDEFTMGSLDLFLSDQTNGFLPTGTGTLTIVGRLEGADQFTITKNSGFPTTTTVNNGFFTINFATDGGADYSNVNIDELAFTIGGGFIEVDIDNLNFCEAVPDVDNQAPAIQSMTVMGTPESTAGMVNFRAVFNEIAQNVTLDDFSVHPTGTATGTLTSITGSGTTYALQVTGISGEGTIQVRLNSGTDIADALGNTPPIEYVNGQLHYVGACYVETFESLTDGAKNFVSNGKSFSLAGNWEVRHQNGYGINASDEFLLRTGSGLYTLNVADDLVTFSQLALYLSSDPGGATPTNDGTLTIRGKNAGSTVYEITKDTDFPTGFGTTNGYFFVDFATDGTGDYSGVFVDALEIELGGGFVYLALDNLGYCSDFEAPAGYTVAIDQDPITPDNETAVSFTFADAEVGTTYNYTFTGTGGIPVTGTGTVTGATQQINGINLTGLDPGMVTLSVILTDASGNVGAAATSTVQKVINNDPTDIILDPDPVSINQSAVDNVIVGTLTSSDPDGGDMHTYTLVSGTGSTNNGGFNISGNSLRATNPSALSAGSNSVRIQTEDNNGGTFQKVFTITVVDDVAPTVSSVAVPASATYVAGQHLDFTVNVSENVTVTGTPQLPLTIGTASVNAAYNAGGSTATALLFRYTIQAGEVDSDGIEVGSSIQLNSGTISDGANLGLILGLNNVGNTTGVLVDGVAPSVTSVDVPANDTYGIGEPLSFTVNFDEAVTVNTGGGSPRFPLTIDTDTRYATYQSGSGTSALEFTYTVGAGDNDINGIAVGTVIELNGSTLQDAAGNSATLILNAIGNTNSILVDGVAPTVSAFSPANGSSDMEPSDNLLITFNEAVALGTGSIIIYDDLATPIATIDVESHGGQLSIADDVLTVNPAADLLELTDYYVHIGNDAIHDLVGNTYAGFNNNTTWAFTVADITAPSGYDVTIDQATITLANYTSLSFTFSAAEVGATFNYEITSSNGGTPVTGNGTITATGQQVSGIHVSGLTNGTLTLSVTLTDASDNEGNPATDNVTKAVSYPPTITTSGETTTFTESVSGSPVPVPIDGALTVSDPDNTTLASATVTITGNFQSNQDVLAFVNNGSTMGNIDGNYSAGTLTLTSPGAAATLAQWQAALRAVTYSNTSLTPNTANRTISFVVNDGLDDSAPGTKTVAVQAVNNAPVITNLDGDAVTFTEDGPAILLDAGGNATVSDSDSPDFDGGNLTVSVIAGGVGSEDMLAIRNEGMGTGQIGASDDSDVYYGGVHIGSANGGMGGADLIVTFLPTATPAAVQALIRNLTYSNSNIANPSVDPRTVRVTLNDGDDATSAPSDLTVNITAVNDAPMVTTSGGAVTFTEPEDGDPVPEAVDPGLTVTDPDNATLASATISITTGSFQTGEDMLSFENDGSTMGDIDGSYDEATGTLMLTSLGATATLAEWQAALRAVAYSNNSQHPNTTTRTISFVVNDGTADSAPATKDINVVAVNTAPVAVDDLVTVNEDIPTTGNALTNDSDVEGNALTASLVTAPVNGTVVLNADGSFTYTPNSNYNGLDSLEYQVCDNGTPSLCDTAWVRFTIGAINDAPVIMAPPTLAADEDVLTGLTGISFADVDAGSADVTVTFSVASGTLSATTGGGVTVSGSETAVLTLVGSITDLNTFIAAGNVGFTTVLDETDDVTLTVHIDDGGNTGTDPGNSGTDDSEAATTTVTITVTAQNDAPVNTVPGSQTIDQNQSLVFSTANSNAISVADVDAGGGIIQVTLTASNGLLTLAGTTGLTFAVGSGAGDATMTFSGTITDINAALDGLTMMPTSGYSGAASFQIVTNDLGLTGAGGNQTNTDVVDITVNEINPEVTSVNTTSPDRVYKMTDIITLTISFDQAVIVDEAGGSPTLLLETGGTDREAVYESGSSSDMLVFNYTVQAGDVSANLDYQSTAALLLNGATIQSASGSDAILTLPAIGGAGSIAGQHAIVIDGVAPTVSSVSVPADGYYVEGEALNFNVQFDDLITVDAGAGNPSIELTVGPAVVQATFTGGSGTNILTFSYTVQSGDLDMDGVALGNAIVPGGGTLHDAAGNDILTSLNNIGNTAGVLINTSHPTVMVATGAGSTVNAPFTATASFSEAVTGLTLDDITVVNATLSDLQTSDDISFTFIVTPLVGGTVELSIAADMAVNIANNGNRASNTLNIQFNEMITGVTLADASFVYDGTAKSLTITGNLPDGTTVAYDNNARTDVGTQEVTATISGSNYDDLVLTADLTVTPATITGITLADASFVYDGTAQSLEITGTLPDGTSVSYADNSRTDVGTQEVTANISGSNYDDLVLTADLTVTPATITGITLADASFVYDGTAQSLEITGTLPDGTSVSYADNSRTDVGTQEVTATVSGGNYDDLVLTADLTVTPATITGIALADASFVYDGTAQSLEITGTLPDGTSVSYADNSRTDVGTQEVTATVSGGNYDDLVLTADLTVTQATRTLAFPALPVKTYGDADFAGGATASSGETVAYTSSDASVVEITAGGQLRITGAGEATITATVPENGNYSNRPEATQVLTIQKATQTITFNAPAQVNRDAGTVPLDVSASSGLPVLLSIDDEEVATLEGTSLNILRLGTVRITATQVGDANHGAAEPVTVTLRVVDPTSDMPIRIHQAVSPNGDGINEYLIIEAIKDYPENRVRIFNRNGTVVYEASGYNNGTVAFRGIGAGQNRVQAGTYFYVAEIRVDGEWKYEKGWFVLRY